MPPRTINPQYSQWMQDFFTQQDYLPTLYQGMPEYYTEPSFYEDYDFEDSEIDIPLPYNDANTCYISGGQWQNGRCIFPRTGEGFESTAPLGGPLHMGANILDYMGIPEGLQPPAGIISDYPEFKEKYEVLDYMIGGEKIREGVESERYKLQDLLGSIQTTGPEGLRVGGVSRELENQRETINQGLADLEAKKAFGLKAQETELAQNVYNLRADYEEQASRDYLEWLSDYDAEADAKECLETEGAIWENGVCYTPSNLLDDDPYCIDECMNAGGSSNDCRDICYCGYPGCFPD